MWRLMDAVSQPARTLPSSGYVVLAPARASRLVAASYSGNVPGAIPTALERGGPLG